MWIPFALSLDKYVNQAGTDVGFGCLLAVALLTLLYFAGARETRSLRDQLDDAHDRIASLEARVTQALRHQAANRAQGPQPTPAPGLGARPGVVPAPSVAATMGGAVSRPSGEAGASGGAGVAQAATPGVTGALLGAPCGAGAPSLGSATRLIPSPQVVPSVSPAPSVGRPADVPAAVGASTSVPGSAAALPAAATAAAWAALAASGPGSGSSSDGGTSLGNGAGDSSEGVDGLGSGRPGVYADADPDRGHDSGDDYEDEFEPDDTMYVPAGATAAGGSARVGAPVVTPAPLLRFDDEDEVGGRPPRRTIPTVENRPSGLRRFAGRLVGGLIALMVVAGIVVALLVITKGGTTHRTGTTAGAHDVGARHKAGRAVFKPASVKVSVLNGTGQAGLAGDVAKLISASGYTVPEGATTNAAVQTDTTTSVAYRPNDRADAVRVAKSLTKTSGVPITQIVPASSAAITSCGTPPTGQAGTCPAKVIVTVGSDLESAATGTSSGA